MNKPNTQPFELSEIGLTENEALREAIDRDFGAVTEDLNDGVSRRRWLQLMGASLALGGVTGCRYEQETIAPFAFRPQNRVPGIPERFASMIDFNGVAQPVFATVYDGRPIKLDGSPLHPCSGDPALADDPKINERVGASTAYTQAEILNLYDPDRLRTPWINDSAWREASWNEIDSKVGFLSAASLNGVAILSEPTSSPALLKLKEQFESRGGTWFTFAPVNDDNTRAGSKAAFGSAMRPHYLMDKAKVIVTLDADPLHHDGGNLVNSRRFAANRDADHDHMCRLYSVESQYTHTGGCADHRMSLPSSRIGSFARALSAAVGQATKGAEVDSSLKYRDKLLACMVQDLVDHEGESLIICGENQPPEVHALVHDLNSRLGNIGTTLMFTDLPDADRPGCLEDIQAFASQAGSLNSLLIIGGNPAYSAPADLEIDKKIKLIDNTVHLSTHRNETSVCCDAIALLAHDLETWNDGYAYDGSVCIGQPLIKPLFNGRSAIEALSVFMGLETTEGLAILRETHAMDDAKWNASVHDGFVADSAPEPKSPTPQGGGQDGGDTNWNTPWDGSSLEVVFTPSNSLFDGRFANNAWMQELPDFFTKIAWDNVAQISPKTAEALGLKQEQLIKVNVNGNEAQIPVNIQPGQADGSIGLALGYGRTECGRVGGNLEGGLNRYAWATDKVGHDVGVLRTAAGWQAVTGATIQATGNTYRLANIQEPWVIEDLTGRDEIQSRMFRSVDSNGVESRSQLIREGSYKSYQEFKSHQSHEDHDHAAHSPQPGKNGELPVLNNLTPVSYEEEHGGDGDGHDDHGHGQHHWPEAFHLHHPNFDITPGARELYRADKTQKDKYGNELRNRWGMSIDLNKCTGCNACVVACQSENNVPIVGKSQVWRGREMQWLRIDRYYGDNLYNQEAAETDDKIVVHQPVTCHHCENAPCETVCPVAATVHSHEGLNDMVYNRCIGTRYCGNNCPYKVRRFNYFNYSDADTLLKYPDADKISHGDQQLLGMVYNPEVTVRSRGVMEKCTYCTQRISSARIKAKVEGRPIGPNEITTACQDACASNAIEFGDLKVPESRVAQAHANPRSYVMLEELNNHPRTRYLARVRNPHPALVDFDDRNALRKASGAPVVEAPHEENATAGDDGGDH